jgi:Transcription factor WhiB
VNAVPSPAATPGSVNDLPCQRDPDRWFDRRNRTHALTGCLACPARSWCARQALSDHATAGMWAGIWIDGNLADVADYLQAIAEAAPPSTPPPPTTIHRTEPPRSPHVIRPPAKHTVAAVITARSSGHCEIMAADCLLTLDAIASRIRGRCGRELTDAAAGYAVCQSCQGAVAWMEPRLSQQLGYIVDNPANAATVPFYWRQSRWMRLDSAGGAAPLSSARRSA